MGQRAPRYENRKLTALAKGMPCQFTVPHRCEGDVVACHANWSKYGKGVHLKVSDFLWAAGCMAIHREIDGKINPTMSRDERESAWVTAFISTWDFIYSNELVKVA